MWFTQSAFFVAFGTTAIDSLFYASTFNLSGHFNIVQGKIKRLRYEINDGHLTREFVNIIRYHQKLFLICDHLTNIYKPILFSHFVISSLQLCVVAYQLTLVSTIILNKVLMITKLTWILFIAITGHNWIHYIHDIYNYNIFPMFCILSWRN